MGIVYLSVCINVEWFRLSGGRIEWKLPESLEVDGVDHHQPRFNGNKLFQSPIPLWQSKLECLSGELLLKGKAQ